MYMTYLRSLFLFLALSSVLQASIEPERFRVDANVQVENLTNHLGSTILPRGRPSAAKSYRLKSSSRLKPKLKSKSRPKSKSSSKSQSSRKSKPNGTKATPKNKPTTVPAVRPRPPPKFAFPTIAFDTCGLYIDCSKDDKDFNVTLNVRSVATQKNSILIKRARTFKVEIGTKVMTIQALDYPVSSDLYISGTGKQLTVHTLNWKDKRIGTTAVIDTQRIPIRFSHFYTEHIIELQTVGMFIEHAVDRDPNLATFFLNEWNKDLPENQLDQRRYKPNIQFGKGRKSLNALVFEALGSRYNRKDFVICEREINAYKERLWSGSNPMGSGSPTSTFEKLVAAANLGKLPSNQYLSGIRTTMAVFNYMNAATVRANMVESVNNVMTELRNVRALTGENTDLASLWEAYIRQILMEMETRGKKWLTARIKYANAELAKTKKKYQILNRDLKKHEESATWNKKQNRQRLKLGSKLKKQTADMMTAGHTLTALEEERDNLVKEIQGADTAAKPPLVTRKDEVKEDIDQARMTLESAKGKVGQTQRDILELTAAGVQQVLQNLQKDKQTLQRYSKSVNALRMPVI